MKGIKIVLKIFNWDSDLFYELIDIIQCNPFNLQLLVSYDKNMYCMIRYDIIQIKKYTYLKYIKN